MIELRRGRPGFDSKPDDRASARVTRASLTWRSEARLEMPGPCERCGKEGECAVCRILGNRVCLGLWVLAAHYCPLVRYQVSS